MKGNLQNNLLLPHGFQKISWVLLLPNLALGIYLLLIGFDTMSLALLFERVVHSGRTVDVSAIGNGIASWLNNEMIVGLLLGALFVSCSRERVEDEMIARIRLGALLSALYVNTAIVIVAALFVYGLDFVDVMVYNLFTLPLLFAAIYRWQLWRLKKAARDEE